MRVRFKADHVHGGVSYKEEQEADLSQAAGEAVVKIGVADDITQGTARNVDTKKKKQLAEMKDSGGAMRIRFRRGCTIDGVDYGPGKAELVPQSQEAWEAVNRGDGDLDPPPGVNGQPFPPEFVQRDERSEAPGAVLTTEASGGVRAVPRRER